MTGKFTTGGMEIPFTQICKRPGMEIMEYTIQGMVTKLAFDGTQGWTLNPMMGKKEPDLMAKDAEKAFRHDLHARELRRAVGRKRLHCSGAATWCKPTSRLPLYISARSTLSE